MTSYKAMRIGISGPAGSGKTTLVRDLASSLQLPELNENWAPIIKARRDFVALWESKASGVEEKRAAYRAWKLSYKKWLDDRYREQSQLDGYVSDRWAVDAYSNWLRAFMNEEDDRMALYLLRALKKHSEMYDFFVLLPVTNESVEEKNLDGLKRNPSLHIKIMANSLNAGLITYFLGRPIIEIPPHKMSREERVDFVLQRIHSVTSRI